MFELLNVKWGEPSFGTPSGQITWSSELNGDLPIASGFDLDDITSSLRAAFDAWENVSAVDFEEVSSGGTVTVSNGPLDAPIVGLAGPFPVTPTSLFTMTSADVIFSDTLGGTLAWSPFGGLGSVDFFSVAVHEIGHIIGLDHPNDPTQIMNAIIQVNDLGLGDVQGAQFVYGTDFDDVPVEPGFPENADEIGLGEDGDAVSSDGGGGGGGGGLIFGLLALIAAIFTGGLSFGALAAGQIAMSSDEDDDLPDIEDDPTDLPDLSAEDLAAIFNLHEDCWHVEHEGGVYHGVSVPEMLPMIDFTERPNPCGCVGLCGHILDEDTPEDGILL